MPVAGTAGVNTIPALVIKAIKDHCKAAQKAASA